MEQVFIDAIHQMKKLRITFYSQKDDTNVVRVCAPMDFGASARSTDKDDRYHFWDYEGSTGPHTTSLRPEQVVEFEVLEEEFDPGEFVTWRTDWHIPRDWGQYS